MGGSSELNSGSSIYQEYKSKGVFQFEYYWSCNDSGNDAYLMRMYTGGGMVIGTEPKSYNGWVRCITQ